MKVLGYVRVSTEEQGLSGLGLDAQREAVTREANHRGWELVGFEEDVASGKSTSRRPGLARALHLLEAPSGPDTLVVAKLDRLSRSVSDFARILEQSERKHWAIVILDLGVDATAPVGKMIVHILAALAQWEREIIGQRTQVAMAAAKARGRRFGRERAIPEDVRRRIRRWRRKGLGARVIADRLNADGVPTAHGGRRWYPSTVQRVFEQERV